MGDTPEQDIEFVTPQEAEDILREAAQPYLEDGWKTVRLSNYLVRLSQEDKFLDIAVDLQGNVSTETKLAAQTSEEIGRSTAWLILLATFLIVLAIADFVGFL